MSLSNSEQLCLLPVSPQGRLLAETQLCHGTTHHPPAPGKTTLVSIGPDPCSQGTSFAGHCAAVLGLGDQPGCQNREGRRETLRGMKREMGLEGLLLRGHREGSSVSVWQVGSEPHQPNPIIWKYCPSRASRPPAALPFLRGRRLGVQFPSEKMMTSAKISLCPGSKPVSGPLQEGFMLRPTLRLTGETSYMVQLFVNRAVFLSKAEPDATSSGRPGLGTGRQAGGWEAEL